MLSKWARCSLHHSISSALNPLYSDSSYPNFAQYLPNLLPNVFGPIIVISSANFAAAILIEAGLSFLGIGIQPPMPSWGGIIRDHYYYIIMGKEFLAVIPGIAIMSLVLSFMILGNGLRDAFDVKTK